MKKILTAIVLFVFVALPMSVMAMTTISDNDLSAVTGQAGVSIGVDVTMNISVGVMAWGDNDGITPTAVAGWVGMKDLTIDNLRIHLRTDKGMAATDPAEIDAIQAAALALFGITLTDVEAQVVSVIANTQLFTIDVYTDATRADDSGKTIGSTAVRFGLPTAEIDMASLTAATGAWEDDGTGVPDPALFQKFGDIYMKNMVMLIGRDNYIDISKNDTASGVFIKIGNSGPSTGTPYSMTDPVVGGNLIDKLTIEAMSWGDTDGLADDTTGLGANAYGSAAGTGYVGLVGFEANAIKVAATLNINVASPTGGFFPALLTALDPITNIDDALPALRNLLANNSVGVKDTIGFVLHNMVGSIGSTFVDIGVTADINIGSMVATAAVGTTPDMGGVAVPNSNIYGQIYLQNMHLVIPPGAMDPGTGVNITPYSWIVIGAH